jgi:hypothetical protein
MGHDPRSYSIAASSVVALIDEGSLMHAAVAACGAIE